MKFLSCMKDRIGASNLGKLTANADESNPKSRVAKTAKMGKIWCQTACQYLPRHNTCSQSNHNHRRGVFLWKLEGAANHRASNLQGWQIYNAISRLLRSEASGAFLPTGICWMNLVQVPVSLGSKWISNTSRGQAPAIWQLIVKTCYFGLD